MSDHHDPIAVAWAHDDSDALADGWRAERAARERAEAEVEALRKHRDGLLASLEAADEHADRQAYLATRDLDAERDALRSVVRLTYSDTGDGIRCRMPSFIPAAEAAAIRAALVREQTECPRCGSPDPRKHPALQVGGEVQPCPDPWHTPLCGSCYVPEGSPHTRLCRAALVREQTR